MISQPPQASISESVSESQLKAPRKILGRSGADAVFSSKIIPSQGKIELPFSGKQNFSP